MTCQVCKTKAPRICYDCHEEIVAAIRREAAADAQAAADPDLDITLNPNRLELTPLPNQRTLDLKDPSHLIV